MDFIKLLDVANPKNVKDTINLLIANYESFGDRVQEIADTAAAQAKQAVEVSTQAQQQIQANTTVVQGAAQDASNARQTSEEALAMIEQADARSTEATGLAETAIAEAGEATSTAELAMNVANEAKSTIDQAISTGTFGSFLYNVNSIAMARAYLTDNVAQENTAEREYIATPKLVRDVLANYYTKSETLSKGAIEILLNDKASQSALTQLSTALNNKVDKTIKINGQPLTQNIVLTAADVGALDEIPADYVTSSILAAQLESLLTNITISYYNKTDADGKFATKSSVESKVDKEITKVVIGDGASFTPTIGYGVVIGKDATSDSANVVAVGQTISNQGKGNVLIGTGNHIEGCGRSIAIGFNSSIYADSTNGDNIAIGGNLGDTNKAIQLGAGTNNTDNTLQIFGDNIYNHETHTMSVKNAEMTSAKLNGNDLQSTLNELAKKPTADYDSGWFNFEKNTTYTFTHNLGTVNFLVLIDMTYDNGTNYFYHQNTLINPDGTGNSYAGGIEEGSRTTTKIYLTSAKNYAWAQSRAVNDAGGVYADFNGNTNCRARVRLFKLGGDFALWT